MKKIIFLIVISAGLFFAPTFRAEAAQVYVGVQVTKAEAPGCTPGTSDCPGSNPTTNSNWCLPVGSKMVITKDEVCTSFETQNSDPSYVCDYGYCGSGHCLSQIKTIETPTCAGEIIYSGLVDLAENQEYKIYLYTTDFCPGYVDGNCWVASDVNEGCCDACSSYGLTAVGGESNCASSNYCSTNTFYDDANCKTEAKLLGSACSSCTTGLNTYSYFNPTTKECFTTFGGWAYYSSCSAAAANVKRVCACNYPYNSTGFLFDFTATGF